MTLRVVVHRGRPHVRRGRSLSYKNIFINSRRVQPVNYTLME